MGFQIYNASAGSGKTYTLTKEYLKILFKAKGIDAYKRILAITFTNKAVEEMKNRIVESLISFTDEEMQPKAQDFLKEIAIDLQVEVPELQEKSRKILKNIIHNYAAFDITTIDKFTLRLIRTFTHDLNLPTNFDVTLDTDMLLRNAIDVVVAKAGENEELTKILINFAKSKTDDDKSWDISQDLHSVSKLILNEENFFNFGKLADKSIADFEAIQHKIKAKVEANKKAIKENSQSILVDFTKNEITSKDFDTVAFPNQINNILNNHKDAFKYDYVNEREIKGKPKLSSFDVIENLKSDWKQKLVIIYSAQNENAMLQLVLKNMIPLSLINVIYKEYKQLQEDQNVLSISDFNKIIHDEIKDQPAPFIYERLGDKYRHYFIDEFQDTSELQWQNFIPLIENALVNQDLDETRGSLMIVGDPKQSIYRWRGGKAEQFIDLSNPEIKSPFVLEEKSIENLPTNYRSFENVIDFNNQFFQFLASEFENENYQKLYFETAKQEFNNKKGGFVSINFLEDTSEVEEGLEDNETLTEKAKKHLSKTVEIINIAVKDGFDYNEIVLLTRKQKQGVWLANYLTEKNIPIISSETLLIQNASEVKFMIHFLSYLDSSENIESKIKWLYYLANENLEKNQIHDFIFEAKDLQENELEIFLQAKGFLFSFETTRKKSLYEAVENTVAVFLKGKATTSYVQYFLDLVLERDLKHQTSIADFLDYWNKTGFNQSIPSPEGEKAIRIMTIHKSKGLEFPVVIYPFADDALKSPFVENIWIPLENETVDLTEVLIPKNKILAKYNDTTNTIFQNKNQEEILDIINVLYVALTRAEEQLHVVSSYKLTKDGNVSGNTLAKFFVNYLEYKNEFSTKKTEYTFGNKTRISSPKEFTKQKETISSVTNLLDFSTIRIAKKEALMWGTKQQDAIEFGNIIHQILSYITTKSSLETAIEKSINEGLILVSDRELFFEKINKIIHHSDLEIYFNEKAQIFTERNIISPNEKNIKPDRVVLLNNEAYLIDYKTGSPEQKHKIQIENYSNVIEKMNIKVVKKTLLYIGEELNIIHL